MGTEPLHFEKPPITEAVIAIQIRDLPASSIPAIQGLNDHVRSSYPTSVGISQTQFVGQISPQGSTASTQQNLIGLQFQSADLKQLFQARLNGFSFHRLAPYDRWRSFRDEASRLWTLYRHVVAPVQPLNFSVRYINALVIPGWTRLEDWLRVYPGIAPELPQVLHQYQMRLEVQLADEGAGPGVLSMHQTLLPSPPKTTSILLDNNFIFSAAGISDDTLWARIDAVQGVKNRIFLGTLTPTMRERLDRGV
jgi:uncharacterized protein (TIGR04255 family)